MKANNKLEVSPERNRDICYKAHRKTGNAFPQGYCMGEYRKHKKGLKKKCLICYHCYIGRG